MNLGLCAGVFSWLSSGRQSVVRPETAGLAASDSFFPSIYMKMS